MATEVGVGYVRLIPTARGFGAEASRALGGPMRDASRQVGDSAGAELTSSMSQRMTSAGGMLTAALTAPLAGIGIAALNTAGDFEKSMNGVRAVTGATGQDFEQLRDLAQDMGSRTQYSANEAADAMEFLGMAGWDTQQIMSGLPDVLNLAAASGSELAEVADIASNIMAGFGIEAEDMGRVSDVLATTLTGTNVTMESLGESMKYAAPLANSAGWSLEETAAAVGTLGNAGIQGSMAGTSLNNILATLADTSSTGGRALEEFGVAAQDSNGDVRPLVDVLDDLAAEGADVSDVIEIFGLESGPKLQALLGQGSDGIRELIADLEDSEGAAQEMADVRMEGFAGSLEELKSAWTGLMIAIMDSGLLEWVTSAVQSLTGFVQRLNEGDDSLFSFASVLGVAAAAAGPLLVAVGQTVRLFQSSLGAISGFVAGTGRVVVGFGSMVAATGPFIARMAVTSAQFVAATARMVAAMTAAAARVVSGWVVMAAQSMMHAARVAAAWVVAMGPVGWIGAAIAALVALIVANWDTVRDATVAAWNWVWDTVSSIVDRIVDIFMNFTPVGLIIQHWDTIRERTVEILSAVVDWIRGVPGMIYDAFLNFTPIGLLIQHWNTIRSNTVSVVTGIVDWLRGLPGMIVSAISTLGSRIVSVARTAWNTFRDATSNRISGVVSLVRGLPRRAVDALGNIASTLKQAGRDLIQGFIDGISEKVGGVRDTLGDLTGSLTSWKGPERVDRRILTPAGEHIITGLQAGIERQIPAVRQQLQGLTSDLPGAAGAGVPQSAHTPGHGAAPAQAQLVLRPDGTRAARALMEVISQSVRTQYGGDVTRLGR